MVAQGGDCDSDIDPALKASRASAQSRELAPAASHVALHFASVDSAAAARHPIAQLGFWQAEVDPTALATAAAVDPPTANRALTVLGSRGLVGFDLAASRWFHRELPFDLTTIEQLHPRLRAARQLCADGAVVVKSHDIEQVRAVSCSLFCGKLLEQFPQKASF